MDIFYKVRLPGGTYTGLTTEQSAKMIAEHHKGEVVVDGSEHYQIKGREYDGQYRTVESSD